MKFSKYILLFLLLTTNLSFAVPRVLLRMNNGYGVEFGWINTATGTFTVVSNTTNTPPYATGSLTDSDIWWIDPTGTQTNFSKTPPYTFFTNAVLNINTNSFKGTGKLIQDFSTTKTPTWRFIYNGTNLISEPFYSGGRTFSPYKIAECMTFTSCTNLIDILGLHLTDSQIEYIKILVDQNSGK